jgi:hypothetical protein
MNQLRMVLKFGTAIEIEQCARLREILSAMSCRNAILAGVPKASCLRWRHRPTLTPSHASRRTSIIPCRSLCSLRSLVRLYQTDPLSKFLTVKWNTRQTYTKMLAILGARSASVNCIRSVPGR